MGRLSHLDLPLWAGYRRGRDGEPSTGRIEVIVHGKRITKAQQRALAGVQAADEAMQQRVLDAVVAAYPKLRARWKRPATMTRARLKGHVELGDVLALRDHHDDLAYVAYCFAPSWDPSSVFVVTHGDRVIATGDHDVLGLPIADAARDTPSRLKSSPAERRKRRAAATKHAAKNPAALDLDDAGEMEVTLPCWAGFGPHAEEDGCVTICLDVDDDRGAGPPQQRAYRQILDEAERMQTTILEALLRELPTLRQRALKPELLPPSTTVEDLTSLVDLRAVHLHHTAQGGVACVGYLLGCQWDQEHGLGVMTHRRRVLRIGGADTAFLGWVAKACLRPKDANKNVRPATSVKRAKPR